MLDTLARIYDDAGSLRGVGYTLLDGDPRFVTSVALRFDSLTAVFRAVSDDDTLSAAVEDLLAEPDETLADASGLRPWASCIGRTPAWAWRMTNQQGYTDGVRFEFGEVGQPATTTVELLVVASALRVFESNEATPG